MYGKTMIKILMCCKFSFSIKFKVSVRTYVEFVRTYVIVKWLIL